MLAPPPKVGRALLPPPPKEGTLVVTLSGTANLDTVGVTKAEKSAVVLGKAGEGIVETGAGVKLVTPDETGVEETTPN